jgi:hypothetical protein
MDPVQHSLLTIVAIVIGTLMTMGLLLIMAH